MEKQHCNLKKKIKTRIVHPVVYTNTPGFFPHASSIRDPSELPTKHCQNADHPEFFSQSSFVLFKGKVICTGCFYYIKQELNKHRKKLF
jgi:hypothetical protein